MESPDHERAWIEEYLRSQSGDAFEIEHVEKLTSEYVMGREYDVWDAHTNEGRWWVITNPTNLYSQQAIKSMDVALSFHVGLMSRVLSSQPQRDREGPESWILDVLRRLDVASSSLDRAKEVEDFQAVGMRLREALVSLGEKLAGLGVVDPSLSLTPKRADFKAWAALAAEALASGSERAELRGLLKATSEKTWAYVSWLTHARRATKLDGRLALAATTQVVEAFITAATQWRVGAPDRCPVCGSSRLTLDTADEGWVRLCETCGWVTEVRPPARAQQAPEVAQSPEPAGDCVLIEDFGIYLSPQEAREMLEESGARMATESDGWSSPFAVQGSDGRVIDAHRMAFEATRGEVAPAVELVYGCGKDACVNPAHALEVRLPDTRDWAFGLIERARVRPAHIELRVSAADGSSRDLFVDRDFLDRFGLGDVSALPERVVLLSPADERGWARLAPVARRVDYGFTSIPEGWVHPGLDVAAGEPCPCGSATPYGSCHGRQFIETRLDT